MRATFVVEEEREVVEVVEVVEEEEKVGDDEDANEDERRDEDMENAETLPTKRTETKRRRTKRIVKGHNLAWGVDVVYMSSLLCCCFYSLINVVVILQLHIAHSMAGRHAYFHFFLAWLAGCQKGKKLHSCANFNDHHHSIHRPFIPRGECFASK